MMARIDPIKPEAMSAEIRALLASSPRLTLAAVARKYGIARNMLAPYGSPVSGRASAALPFRSVISARAGHVENRHDPRGHAVTITP